MKKIYFFTLLLIACISAQAQTVEVLKAVKWSNEKKVAVELTYTLSNLEDVTVATLFINGESQDINISAGGVTTLRKETAYVPDANYYFVFDLVDGTKVKTRVEPFRAR